MKHVLASLLFLASTAFAQVTVTPGFTDPRGGAVIQIRGTKPSCGGPCQIAFGGVVSPKVTDVAGGFDAVAPPHDEGVVPITIGIGPVVLQTIERKFAYIVDREQVLVPVSTEGMAGPYGALWATELWVHNGSDHDVALRPAVCGGLGGITDCGGDRMIVAANGARKVPALAFMTPDYLGLFLYPPRELSSQISFDLRLIDRARAGGGTALPVVRESALHRAKLTMLNVPGDSVRARKRLRIFAASDATFTVRVYDLDTGRQLAERQLYTVLPTDRGGPPLLAYTINDDVFDGGAARLRVDIEEVFPGSALVSWWAFISVTDNVTQQVTVIAPQ
jgi:hypothetical protein